MKNLFMDGSFGIKCGSSVKSPRGLSGITTFEELSGASDQLWTKTTADVAIGGVPKQQDQQNHRVYW
jgi:hypothetical protein